MKRTFVISVIIVFSRLFLFSQDFSYDKKIGAEAAEQVESMMGLYNDSSLNAYVNSVGGRLVNVLGDVPVDFQFHVVDVSEPNAFALPGGYIYVTRGVLNLVNDESELACVIGHEMIHVTKRHSVKQMKKGILPGLLRIPGAIVGIANESLGRLIDAPLAMGSQIYLSSYSRGQEKEADRYGVKLASQAGYDPNKLAIILDNLSKEVERVTGEKEKRSYLASHPYTPKREAYLAKEIEKLEWNSKPSIADNKETLYGKLDGMYFGENPQQGVFDDNVFKQPDMNFAIAFPKTWETQNIPVAVGAAQPGGEAQIVFRLDDPDNDPDSLGLAFAEYIKKNYKLNPKESKSLTINGNPAYLVSIQDNSGSKPVEVQVYWLKTDSLMFNIMGMSYLQYSDTITQIVHSVRSLTNDEKSGITGLKIRVAKAKENETIEEFSSRTNNHWDAETTILMNGLQSDEKLKSGQVLKIAVEEPYFSKDN